MPILLYADVWVYSKPAESVEASPLFKVTVVQAGREYESFVNYSKADHGNTDRSSSFATFSFSGKIEIVIEVLVEKVNNCVIRPKADSISFVRDGNLIRVELEQAQKLAIEINGNKKDALFVFADPPEEHMPADSQKGLWNFEPGIHSVGMVEVPDSVKHIYISGGSIVYGAFINRNKASSFKISGRGILSAERFKERIPRIIKFEGGGLNVFIEGIVVMNGKSCGIELEQSYSTVRNCKIMGWHAGSDGLESGPHALVEDCFFRCNGDALKVYGSHFFAQNCVFWQNESGACFQLSWNRKEDDHNFRITDCDIIHCEHDTEAHNAAIFSAVHGGSGKLSNYLFEDIRIEGNAYRLFKLTIRTSLYDDEPGYGRINALHFKNINLEGQCLMANEIWGYNSKHSINEVRFENLSISNGMVDNAKAGNFKINLNTSSGIVFK